MKFWDSSAIVPLVIEESTSRACRQLLRADSVQIVWCLTSTEVVSALVRQRRSGSLSFPALAAANSRIEKLAARWSEIVALEKVRVEANRLLRQHPLRSADALQLAAARVWAEGKPRGKEFVALDQVLITAARAEGFQALVPGIK